MPKFIKALLTLIFTCFIVFFAGKIYFYKNSYDPYPILSNADWFDSAGVQSLLDQKTHSKASTGNKLTLLINGVTSNAQRKKNLVDADIILIKTFEFHDDETGNELIDLLLKKAQAGAKIFIQFDVKGTFHKKDQYPLLKGTMSPIPKNLQKLQDAAKGQVFIIPTSIPSTTLDYTRYMMQLYYPLDHDKYFITWNSTNKTPVKIIMGGMNIGDQYLLGGQKGPDGQFKTTRETHVPPFRDTDVELIGPTTQDIIDEFILSVQYHLNNKNIYFQKNLKQQVKVALEQLQAIQQEINQQKYTAFPNHAGHALVRFIHSSPYREKSNDILNIQNAFDILINSIPNGKTVTFATAFFYPPSTLKSDIFTAAARGVYFKFLLNSVNSPDKSIRNLAKIVQCIYPAYLKYKTIAIYDWLGSPAMGVSSLHQKVYSFGESDQDPFVIGSANMDIVSILRNSEDILLIQDPELKKQFDAMLRNDFNQPGINKISLEDLKNETFFKDFKNCSSEFLYNLLAS